MRYEYLNRIRITLHEQQQKQLSKETLKEIGKYTDFEFYPQSKIKSISENEMVQSELNNLINKLLEIRKQYPDGSNQECMCMDQITELLSKLDMLNFRKVNIEGLFVRK